MVFLRNNVFNECIYDIFYELELKAQYSLLWIFFLNLEKCLWNKYYALAFILY